MANKKRRQDWHKKFAEFLMEKADKPFKWGQNDCIMFPARAAQAMTGYNFVAENKREGRHYTSREQAEAMLKKHFKGKIENVFTHFLGQPKDNVAFAKRGDIVILEHGGETVGGVVDDSGRKIVCAGPRGLVRLPKRKALKYWSLGEG